MNTDLLYYWANQFTPLLQVNLALTWCLVCFAAWVILDLNEVTL